MNKYYYGTINTSLSDRKVEFLKKMVDSVDDIEIVDFDQYVNDDSDMVYGSVCYVCVKSTSNSEKVHYFLTKKFGLKLEEKVSA